MLIVDDSAVARAVIARIVNDIPGFTVVESLTSARQALEYLCHHRVDIVLLDIIMPGVDGLTALPDLITAGENARILIVSSSCEDGCAATVQALALGAADTLVKPGPGSYAGSFATRLQERLIRLAGDSYGSQPMVPTKNVKVERHFDIVAVGASTGGIHALTQLLRQIPASFEPPILVTQHLPESFMPYFAAQLALIANRPCEVARNGMAITPGRILVAPGTAHLCCVRTNHGYAVRLSDTPVANGCMPSVDPMFSSLGEAYGDRVFAVVLSGMGRDGATGAARLHETGSTVVVQDRNSSVVWGMPGAIATAGHASAVLKPEEIGALIAGSDKR
ncbi:chemotaxis response regulator protein-glutamate methylesterase [Stakelama sediminis]|uniref:chemotaxis protein CheB n=1 Tax=Stakelama sediminis TaxID=463200 RepID=UPI0031B5D580